MPVETGMYANFLRPIKSVNDYAAEETAQKQNLIGLQDSQIKLDASKQARTDEQAARAALINAGGDVSKALPSVMGAGAIGQGMKLGEYVQKQEDHKSKQSLQGAQEAQARAQAGNLSATTAKTAFDTYRAQTEDLVSHIRTLQTPADVFSSVAERVKNGLMTASAARMLLSDMPDDPNQLKLWKIDKEAAVRKKMTEAEIAHAKNADRQTDNAIVNTNSQLPLRAAQTEAAITGARAAAAKSNYETPTTIPVPGMATSSAAMPSPVQSNGGLPRISPQQQSTSDQQAVQILAQKYLSSPQEMARIDQNIAQAQASMAAAPVEMRGVLQRDIAGMQMAKQMAGGQIQPQASPQDANNPALISPKDRAKGGQWGTPTEVTGPDGQPRLAVQNKNTGFMHDANTLLPLGVAGPKLGESAQKQLTGVTNTVNSIQNYRDALKSFNPQDILSPNARARMGTYYNDMLLQAKEAYNLGVLNGPDYMILQQVITSPMTWRGGITSKAALDDQAKQLDQIMRKVGQTVTKTQSGITPPIPVGPPPPGAVRRMN